MKRVLLILLANFILNVSAFADEYRCKIMDLRSVTSDGLSETDDYWLHASSRQDMVIDRESGRVYHSILGNSSESKNSVLDLGSDQQRFKLLSVWGSGHQVNYYEVDEYGFVIKQGLQLEKPVRVMANGWLATGICTRSH